MKRNFYLYACYIFIFALAVRLVFNYHFTTPWTGDEPHLFRYALNVMNGEYYGTTGVYWPPGYLFFMGVIFKIFGEPSVPSIYSVQIIQSIMGALTAVFIFFIIDKMFKCQGSAIIGGFMYAVWPPAILYTGRFLAETVWLCFVFLGIWLTYVSIDREKKSNGWLYVGIGFVFGIAALIRPTSLPLVALVVLLFLLQRMQWNQFVNYNIRWRILTRQVVVPCLIIGVVTIATCIPWAIRNYIVVGEPVLFSVNPGINLYLAHNEKATGMWVDMGLDDPVLALGDSPEVNREGKTRAYAYMRENPKKTLTQAYQVHKWFWTLENVDVERLGPQWLRSWYQIFSFRLLALLGIVGMLLSLRYYWRSTLWILCYMVSYNGLIAFLYYAPRYRFAIEPFLIIFAAFTVHFIMKLLGRQDYRRQDYR